jgi:hypothetical protein
MKLFSGNIRYSPEETTEARTRAIASGSSARKTAKIRAYLVTTEYDRFEKYRITRGCFGRFRMCLAEGFRYLFDRLKYGRLSSHSRIEPPPETYQRPG